jgi:hypothetical protein
VRRLWLHRYLREREVRLAVERGELVTIDGPIDGAASVSVSGPKDRRYLTPTAAEFLQGLAADYWAVFKKPLIVDSAVTCLPPETTVSPPPSPVCPPHRLMARRPASIPAGLQYIGKRGRSRTALAHGGFGIYG